MLACPKGPDELNAIIVNFDPWIIWVAFDNKPYVFSFLGKRLLPGFHYLGQSLSTASCNCSACSAEEIEIFLNVRSVIKQIRIDSHGNFCDLCFDSLGIKADLVKCTRNDHKLCHVKINHALLIKA